MRFATAAVLVAGVFVIAACDPVPITTSPGCHASVLHQRVLGWPRLRTVILAIDPSVREVLSDARLAEIRDALRDAVHILVTGDGQLDGDRDFDTDEGVRLVVMTTDGGLLVESTPPPHEVPAHAAPVADPWIELWPDTDPTWTRWFVDVAETRIDAALEGPVVEDASPARSILALAESSRCSPKQTGPCT